MESLEWVPLDKMRTPAFALRLSDTYVARIADGFDPDKLGVLTVSFLDGAYWVIDGNYRVAAMRSLGWDGQEVRCRVFRGLTAKQEAELFLRVNTRCSIRRQR